MYYDGQGFIVRKSLNIKSAKELNGASICVQAGTTTELNLGDFFFRANNMKYEVITFSTEDETVKAYESGRCDSFTSDQSQIYAIKLKLTNAPTMWFCRADLQGAARPARAPRRRPVVRSGEVDYYALLNSEELGVSQKTLDHR